MALYPDELTTILYWQDGDFTQTNFRRGSQVPKEKVRKFLPQSSVKHGCDIWNSCSPHGTLRIASTQAHTEETHRAATPYCMPCRYLLLTRNLGSGLINHNLQVEKSRHMEAHEICLPETQYCRKHLASQQKDTG